MADKISTKRIQVDKANATILIFMGVAAFLTTFCIIASRSLLERRAYQVKVIQQKKTALNQLNSNIAVLKTLNVSYSEFQNQDKNIIGGLSDGTGERDGDNARIILDALPSKYDFPALTSSIEKILTDPNYEINSIVGKDDEVAQRSSESTTPVEIPFEMEVTGRYTPITGVIDTLERSIRPFKATSVQLSAEEDKKVKLTFKGVTYFLPEKTLKITTQDVPR